MEQKELRKIIESFELVKKASEDAIKSLEELSEEMSKVYDGVIKDGKIYLCKDRESFKDFMKECEKQGFKWHSNDLPTEFTPSWVDISLKGILIYIDYYETGTLTYNTPGDDDDTKNAIVYEKKEEPKILYLCDRKQCKECKDFCTHTTDITHAANFKDCGDGYYVEEEPTTGSLEMKIDAEQFETFMKALFKNNEKPYKKVTRKAKEGEYIKIVNRSSDQSPYNNGDIFKVEREWFDRGVVVNLDKQRGEYLIWHEEYVVLEGCKPPKIKKKK